MKRDSGSLPALVHGRQSHLLVGDSWEAVPISYCFSGPEEGQVREKDVLTWRLVMGCEVGRSALPDVQPHGSPKRKRA